MLVASCVYYMPSISFILQKPAFHKWSNMPQCNLQSINLELLIIPTESNSACQTLSFPPEVRNEDPKENEISKRLSMAEISIKNKLNI